MKDLKGFFGKGIWGCFGRFSLYVGYTVCAFYLLGVINCFDS